MVCTLHTFFILSVAQSLSRSVAQSLILPPTLSLFPSSSGIASASASLSVSVWSHVPGVELLPILIV